VGGVSVPPGVTVFCNPTLAPAFRALDGLGGVPVAALSAPAGLMLAQMTRHTRDDLLFTTSAAVDQATAQGLVLAQGRVDGFANAVVLAAMAGFAPAGLNAQDVAALVAGARVAVTDATAASELDGRAVLAANGLASLRVKGAANTGDVAFLVTTGAVDIGLMYLTDVKADPRLAVVASLQADPALTKFSGAVNAKAVSPDAQKFLLLLQGDTGKAALLTCGLTVAA
jgi:molybdate transport system substrate-binding protein